VLSISPAQDIAASEIADDSLERPNRMKFSAVVPVASSWLNFERAPALNHDGTTATTPVGLDNLHGWTSRKRIVAHKAEKTIPLFSFSVGERL
jgi:hypothetical protein